MGRPRKMGPLLWRLARALIVALLASLLLYVIAINVFLSTSLFARVVDGKPDVIDIHYERGWSWIPGRIHAQNLSVRGRDGNVEWILRLDDVQFDVAFRAFAHRRFEATHVHGRGISFRARQRLDAPPKAMDEVADLPPIDGLGPYAVRPPPEFDPGLWDDRKYRLWGAHLEDVVADDVREIWIDHVRVRGSMRIAGRFFFQPNRHVDVGPVHVDVRDGDARRGGDVLLDGLAGAVADVSATFDPRTARGMDLVRRFAVTTSLHPRCPDVDRLRIAWPAEVGVHGEFGARRFTLVLYDGWIREGTEVDAVFPHGEAARREHRFTAGLAIAGKVTGSGREARFAFQGELSELAVARAPTPTSGGRVFVRVPRAALAGDARALDLADLLADVHLTVDVPAGDVPDVSALSSYIPPATPLAMLGGRGQVSARLETWRGERRAKGRADLRVDELDMRVGRMRILGAGSASASFGGYTWETSRATDAVLSLRVEKGVLAADRAPHAALLRVAGLHLAASASEVALDDPLRSLHAAIAVEQGDLVDPGLLRAYLPSGPEMRVVPGQARVVLASELVVEDHLARGTLDLSSRRLGLEFRDFRAAVEVQARARVHDWQWDRGESVLDEATVDIARGEVKRTRGPGGDSRGRSECRDGSPDDPRCLALSLGRIHLSARSRRFLWTDPLADIHLRAAIADAQVHDPSIVNAFLPRDAPFSVRGSEGRLSSEVTADIVGHVLRGAIGVRAHGLAMGGDALSIGGDLDFVAHVSGFGFDRHVLSVVDSQVGFTHVEGRFADTASPGAAPDFRADAVELRASIPRLDLVRPSLRGVDARVRIAGAVLPDARVLGRFLPDGILAVESGKATVSGDLEVSSTHASARGALDVRLPRAGVRFRQTHLGGDFDLAVHLAGYAPETDRFDVSGSRLTMRDVEVTNASTNTSRWQGEVTLGDAGLTLDAHPELEGEVAIDARDASPILAVLLGNGLPTIFAGLTSMPHLSGTARLTVGSNRIAVRGLDARGGDLSIDGIYVAVEGHRAGAFVVGKGPFSAGFHLDDEGAHLRLFGLQGWLRDATQSALEVFEESAPGDVGAAARQATP